MGLDGKSLWLTMDGRRKGPYRIAIMGAGMGSPACRRYAIELIPGMPDEFRSVYLDPHVANHIRKMDGSKGKLRELDLDEVAASASTV